MITSYDTQTIANGAIQALVRQEVDRQTAAREAETDAKLRAMAAYIRELEERLTAKTRRVDDLCAQLMETLPDTYPAPEPGSRLGNALWGLVGLGLIVYDRLNERAVRRWYP